MKGRLILVGIAISAVSHADVIIDDFTDGAFLLQTPTTAYDTQTGSVPNIVQGFRMAQAIVGGHPNNRDLLMEVSGGKMFVEAGSGVAGSATLQWFNSYSGASSGAGSPNISDYVPFAPTLDLSGEKRFRVHYENADQTTTIFIAIYAPDLLHTRTLALPAAPGSGIVEFEFSDFTTGSSSAFANIGMIEMTTAITNGNDITYTKFEAVPEPASAFALMSGATLLVIRKKRRKRVS